jgi:hypothetical protein
MRNYTPIFIALRVIVYSLLVFGIAEFIRFDAMYPMEEALFGEISRTEFSQEFILFVLVIFYLMLGYRYRRSSLFPILLRCFYLLDLSVNLIF